MIAENNDRFYVIICQCSCNGFHNLGLDELFTNIISYGFGDKSEHQIKFSLAKERETLVVQVEDDGIPFNPLDVTGPEGSQDLDSINVGGLGIHLNFRLLTEQLG